MEKECLFCHPYEKTHIDFEGEILEHRVLYETQYFYVMLSLGPIVEGCVILVAKEHIRSMLDLPGEQRKAYEEEKGRLRELIWLAYGRPAVVTEHGRIQACIVEDNEAHDLLCYHAHQIFFPLEENGQTFSLVSGRPQLEREGPFELIFYGTALAFMDTLWLEEEEEYLLFENGKKMVSVYKVWGKCPRQYLRYIVARAIGSPEWANWASYPFEDRIIKAKARFQSYLHELGIEEKTVLPQGFSHENFERDLVGLV